jgi:hypothetical protein
MVKVRQPDGVKPKYREVFRDQDRPLRLFPGAEVVRPDRPLVIVEGEFDALFLGQVLEGLASVVTLGSASNGPDTGVLLLLLGCPRWFVAHDADDAGDRAAAVWTDAYPRAKRVRPPVGKDWTEAASDIPGTSGTGIDLRRWWADVLSSPEPPVAFTWEELASWRWGPAVGDSTPGIDSTGPGLAAFAPGAGTADDEAGDEYARIERAAIQMDSCEGTNL